MSRIEDQANYYKNYHWRYRDTIAVIHVEDEDDKNFWLAQLKNVKKVITISSPGVKVRLVTIQKVVSNVLNIDPTPMTSFLFA